MIYAETDRLYLRQLAANDLPRVVELIGNWEVARWIARVPYPYAQKDADEWLAMQQAHYAKQVPEFFVIADKTNNRLLGGIGIHASKLADELPGGKELGYWLGQPYWGQGIMSEAVSETVKYGFGRMAVSQLFATTDPENQVSQQVLRKAGFTQSGMVLRDPAALRGPESMLLWRLTREDYQASMGITLESPRP